jgi:hypothetical protein
MSKHFEKLQVLSINHNKIGIQGARCLGEYIGQCKSLVTLDLSHDEIGDLGMYEIITQLDNYNTNLEELNIGGN